MSAGVKAALIGASALMRCIYPILIAGLLLARQSVAGTLHVPADYPAIQAAINAAVDGDTVLVAPGTYFENLNFNGKAITVVSSDGPQTTTVDGGRAGSVVTFTSGEGSGSVLGGFTLQDGIAYWGAGATMSLSSPTIVSNIFQNNEQYYGGFGAGIGGNSASPIIEKNIFRDNTVESDTQYSEGVVCFFNSSSPLIADNIFLNNPCRAINILLPAGNTPVVINNTFVSNSVAIAVNVLGNTGIFCNNILVDNDIGVGASAGITWDNNLVYGGQTGYSGIPDQTGINGNISADPVFACPASGDYRLLKISPCIDAGTNLGAILPATDFDGNPRIIAGNSNGVAIVDMGAYEFDPATHLSACPTVSGPAIVTTECGSPVTVTVLVGQSDGDAFTVVWMLNGTVVQTNWVPASQSAIVTNISFVAGLPLSTNLVEAAVMDSSADTAYYSTIVTIVDTTPPILICPTNMTVDFDGVIGAPVIFTATATGICSGTLPVNCAPPSGSIFAIGTNTVTCTAMDGSGNISQSNFLVTVLGAHGVEANVLAELRAFQSGQGLHAPLLNRVIADLTLALAPGLWAGEMNLTAGNGKNVFNEEADAVQWLSIFMPQNQGTGAKMLLQRSIDRLVKVDRVLAVVQIQAATARGLSARQLSNASRELNQGDAAVARQQYVSAISHYQNAWNTALHLTSH